MKSVLMKSVPMKNWYLFTGIMVSLTAHGIFTVSTIGAIEGYGVEAINLVNLIALLVLINIVAIVVSAMSEPMNKFRFTNLQLSQFVISLLVVSAIAIYTQELLSVLYAAIMAPSLFFMMIGITLKGIELENE